MPNPVPRAAAAYGWQLKIKNLQTYRVFELLLKMEKSDNEYPLSIESVKRGKRCFPYLKEKEMQKIVVPLGQSA